jgi:hypothetical protein
VSVLKVLQIETLRFLFNANFQARSQNCEKSLLAPSCLPPVLLSTRNNSAPNGRIFIKFDVYVFLEKKKLPKVSSVSKVG